MHEEKEFKAKKAIFRSYQLLWYFLGLIEVLLLFRLLLKFIGANPGSGFTQMVYSLSSPFAVPFLGVVPVSRSGISVFEWSTIIAMAVYYVIVWGIIELFQLAKPVDRQEVEHAVDEI